jgi:hypothetical protein
MAGGTLAGWARGVIADSKAGNALARVRLTAKHIIALREAAKVEGDSRLSHVRVGQLAKALELHDLPAGREYTTGQSIYNKMVKVMATDTSFVLPTCAAPAQTAAIPPARKQKRKSSGGSKRAASQSSTAKKQKRTIAKNAKVIKKTQVLLKQVTAKVASSAKELLVIKKRKKAAIAAPSDPRADRAAKRKQQRVTKSATTAKTAAPLFRR